PPPCRATTARTGLAPTNPGTGQREAHQCAKGQAAGHAGLLPRLTAEPSMSGAVSHARGGVPVGGDVAEDRGGQPQPAGVPERKK
ncbi:hypothetical protein MHW47_06260, partial [Streptomyces sp. OfavH-34-F]|uniref:hypothetical protein n=1 Tax=Streptomyces sp. OfavH-34-F TaxID=2917760 RepID=UPI001EF34632